MIRSRSTHMESAFFTCGSRSSRFWGLRGFEFQVMFVVSAPGTLLTTMLSSSSSTWTALNGTWSTQSRLPWRSSEIIESALVKYVSVTASALDGSP